MSEGRGKGVNRLRKSKAKGMKKFITKYLIGKMGERGRKVVQVGVKLVSHRYMGDRRRKRRNRSVKIVW